jgi:hypothetical protein
MAAASETPCLDSLPGPLLDSLSGPLGLTIGGFVRRLEKSTFHAGVAELADAPDSKSGTRKSVEVQVLSPVLRLLASIVLGDRSRGLEQAFLAWTRG